jgi:hydroxymethylpyrimidine pyrophosphatase-like HAD family hydrolase
MINAMCFEVDDQQYSDRMLERAQLKVFGIPDHFPIPPILLNMENVCVTKILLPNFDIYKNLKANFGEMLHLICTDRGELIQIMNKNASKEEALKKVLHLINVSPDQTVAFGDDINDLGMLTMCGYSVAMGNAIDKDMCENNH